MGGAVRNGLMGESINDIDISTTLMPIYVVSRLKEKGYRFLLTGITYGTVTVIINGTTYDVTTLREELGTQGRHPKVSFGRDWKKDARRRDFTMNALSVSMRGELFDPLNGHDDLEARRIRFIGNPEERILQDPLRILRFFRFFAWYGNSFFPDPPALKACNHLKYLLNQLSAERIWTEFSKLLSAPDPGRALFWMDQIGILSLILPQIESGGIDTLSRLVKIQQQEKWPSDPILRLMSIISPNEEGINALNRSLKLPKILASRLITWARSVEPDAHMSFTEFEQFLYCGEILGIIDRLSLATARELSKKNDQSAQIVGQQLYRLLKHGKTWKKPKFPVSGRDLLTLGYEPGSAISIVLTQMEKQWVDSGFSQKKKELLGILSLKSTS